MIRITHKTLEKFFRIIEKSFFCVFRITFYIFPPKQRFMLSNLHVSKCIAMVVRASKWSNYTEKVDYLCYILGPHTGVPWQSAL